jgi:hypothetical protein
MATVDRQPEIFLEIIRIKQTTFDWLVLEFEGAVLHRDGQSVTIED